MIRRISKQNDLRDIIKSCPSGVIDDIIAIYYYIQGTDSIITTPFEKVGNQLIVNIPSDLLNTLPDGILMRRAYYMVEDASFPDGYYNLTFDDNMEVWLETDPFDNGDSDV